MTHTRYVKKKMLLKKVPKVIQKEKIVPGKLNIDLTRTNY